MKTDTTRYLTRSQLKGHRVRASLPAKARRWCAVVDIYATDSPVLYVRVKPLSGRGRREFVTTLDECRDACGRRFEILREKGMKR